jgi:hypothetical protein
MSSELSNVGSECEDHSQVKFPSFADAKRVPRHARVLERDGCVVTVIRGALSVGHGAA